MAKTVEIILEVDDRGTATVKKFGTTLGNESRKGTDKASAAYSKMSKNVSRSLDQAAARVTRFGKIAGMVLAGAAMYGIIKGGADFQQSMANVKAISQAAGDQLTTLSNQARELGRSTVFTAAQAGEAMEKLALAGFEVNEIIGVMPDVLKLAAAGELEMAEAASITANVMRSMGLAVSEFNMAANSMMFTASNSNQVVSDLGSAFKFVGPVARTLGVELKQVNSMLGILANVGIKGEMAGTALRRSFAVFLGDLEEGELGLGEFAEGLRNSADGSFDFAAALDAMRESGMEADDIMKAFGQRAGPAMLALMRAGGDAVRDFQFAMDQAGNVIEQVSRDKLDTFKGELALTKSALADVGIEIFNNIVPKLRAMLKSVQESANSFSAFLASSNFLSGLGRVAKLTAYALGLIVAARIVKGFMALRVQIIQVGLALDATALSAIKANASFKTFGALAMSSKLAVGGLVAAVGLLSYQLTRAVMELTGWDVAVQEFFETMWTSFDDLHRKGDNVAGQIEWLATKFDALGGITIGEGFISAEEINKVRQLSSELEDYIALGLKTEAKQTAEAIAEFGDEILRSSKVVRQAQEISKNYAEQWEQAAIIQVEAGATVIDLNKQIKDSLELITKKSEDAVEAEKERIKSAENAAKQLAQDTKLMEQALESFGYASETMVSEFASSFERVVSVAQSEGVPFAVVVMAMEDRIIKLIAAAQSAGTEIPAALRQAFSIIEQGALADLGSIKGPSLDPIEEPIVSIGPTEEQLKSDLEMFAEYGNALTEINAEGWNIRAEHDAGIWSELTDTYIAESNLRSDHDIAAMEAHKERLGKFTEDWNAAWSTMAQQQIANFANMAASTIVEGGNLSKMLMQIVKGFVKQAIGMLIQYGIQRIILSKITSKAQVAETTTGMAKAVGLTFANQFASMSAAPFPVNLTAPMVAATMAAMAAAGSSGAAASGAAVGAGIGLASAASAEGSIVTKPVNMLMGEGSHPEGVFPLKGPHAKNTLKALGAEGGGGSTIIVEQHFHGDNWQEDGVSSELATAVFDAAEDAIRLGVLLPSPEETT